MNNLSWGSETPDLLLVCGVPTTEDMRKGRILSGTDGAMIRNVMTSLGIDLGKDVAYMSVFEDRECGPKPKIDLIRGVTIDLLHEIERYEPKVVLTLGDVATTALQGHGGEIGKRRGKCTELKNSVILPTRDPGAIIKSPDGFPDLITDVEKAIRIIGGAGHTIQPPYDNYHIIDSEETFNEFMTAMAENEHSPLSIDIETTGLNPWKGSILSIGVSWRREEAYVIDCVWLNSMSERYRNAFEDSIWARECIMHNAQFDALWLRSRGFDVNLIFDTMLAHYLLDGRQDGHSLKRLAADRYDAPAYEEGLAREAFSLEEWKVKEYRDQVMLYNGADADYTLRLYQDLKKEMIKDGVAQVHNDILIPAVTHFIRLRENGMLVDVEYLDSLGKKWEVEIASLEDKLKKFPGAEDMNLRSTKQVKEYLYDTLKLTPMGGKKNAPVSARLVSKSITGVQDEEAQEFWRTSNVQKDLKSSSTGTYMLYWLAQQHEFPRLLVTHRILSKLKGAYCDGYKEIMDDQNRIRPQYKLHGTRTGRISSNKPNIHGMPRRKEIKRIFIADPGHVIISADYSQAEIRMVAHLAGDETLIAALDAQDIHREISKQMFGLTDEQLDAMPNEERAIKRRAAKTIAFGLIYGRSANSIAPQLDISNSEAKEYMEKFFRMMPKVAKWLARQKATAKMDHEVESLYGRKRRFPIIASKSHLAEIQRQAGNMPVQSSVSDMTLLANMRIIADLEERGIPCLVWPHVHDGFYFQVPEEHEVTAIEVTRDQMHAVGFHTDVDFKCEIETGKSWGDLKIGYEG